MHQVRATDATIPAAARLMNTHHVRRLPVIDADGKLAGIVSRRDLLSVFLRPDAEIIHDARQVLAELALTEHVQGVVAVRDRLSYPDVYPVVAGPVF